MDRKTINSLLTKVGVTDPGRLQNERASQKLAKRLAQTVPDNLTEEEAALVEAMGFKGNGHPVAVATADEDEEAETTTKAASAEDEPVSKVDLGIIKTLLLRFKVAKKQIKSLDPDRAKEKLRNQLAEQGVPETLTDDQADLVKRLGFEVPDAVNGDGESTETTTKAEKPAKAPKSAKSSTKAEAKSETKADKSEAKTEVKADPKSRGTRDGSAVAVYTEIMADTKPRKKEDVVRRLSEKSGCAIAYASRLVLYSKRPPMIGKKRNVHNPVEFQIEETKDDKGVKFIQRKA